MEKEKKMISKELTKAQLSEELEDLRKQYENLVIENFEQKIVEGILLESKEWLQHIIQQMPFPIEVSASDGSTTLVNQAFLNVFDYKNIEDVLGRHNGFSDPMYKEIIEDVKSVYKGEKILSAELNLHVKKYESFGCVSLEDGSVILELIMFPLLSLAGEVRRVVKIWKDVTGYKNVERLLKREQTNLEELVKERTEELAKANKAKDKFFSLISHDLRSPFNGMLGLTNILVDDFDNLEKEEMRPFVENLRSSTFKIYNLIENLLEWSNIMLDRISFNPEVFDFYEEAIYASASAVPEAEKNGIKIKNLVEEFTNVYADQSTIQSVMFKLVNNAVRFNKPNGQVVISASAINDYVEIQITDTGMGIDKKRIENLFKIDENTKTAGLEKECGSGLGLVICKELIEKNMGTINIISSAERGTTVSITLPSNNINKQYNN